MFTRSAAVACTLALVMGACSSAAEVPRFELEVAPDIDRPEFDDASVVIETSEGSVLVPVEVAETDEQRQFGLMHVESLGDDGGMVFIFFEESSGGFWMKNTLIPLSIAFFDVDGEIVRILDMEPCDADPCPVYDPGAPYMGALEVNKGSFDRWGVREGDQINITR